MRCDRAEALLIFDRGDERTDHAVLFGAVAQRSAVNLAQPEEQASDIGITSQITEVLRGNEGTVVFLVNKGAIIDRVCLRVVIGEPIQDRAPAARVEKID